MPLLIVPMKDQPKAPKDLRKKHGNNRCLSFDVFSLTNMQLSKSRVFRARVRPALGRDREGFLHSLRERKLVDRRGEWKNVKSGKGKMEASGFEPLTYCVQSSRSTN
jgi:hypothetical protein